jgi:hypothetical protein
LREVALEEMVLEEMVLEEMVFDVVIKDDNSFSLNSGVSALVKRTRGRSQDRGLRGWLLFSGTLMVMRVHPRRVTPGWP